MQEKTKEEEEAEGEPAAGGGACGKPLVADKLTHLVVELAAPIALAGRPLRLVAHSLPIVLIVNVSQVFYSYVYVNVNLLVSFVISLITLLCTSIMYSYQVFYEVL